jgi:hypothetical protein
MNVFYLLRKVLVACCIVSSLTSSAQLEKKTWLLGGEISYTKTKVGGPNTLPSTSSRIIVDGNIGIFLIDRFCTGLRPGFENIKTNFSTSSTSFNNVYVGPFARYYFLPQEQRLNLLADLCYQYAVAGGNTGETRRSSVFSGVAGIAAFLNTSVALEFLVGYSTQRYPESKAFTNRTSVKIGLQFHLAKE